MDKYQKGFATLPLILLVLLVIGVGTYVGMSDKTATTDTTDSGEIFCTQEAMQCPDGSYVGRTGPNCEFAACPGAPTTNTPGGNSIACSQEAKQCSDGSYVTRTGPNCDFAQCPR